MNTKKYIILTFALSWGLFAVALILNFGFGMTFLLEEGSISMEILTILYAWMPNIVIFVLFPVIVSNMTRKEFLHELFRDKLNGKLIFGILFSLVAISLGSAKIVSAITNTALSESIVFNWKLAGESALLCFLTGAFGEECGWRGFLLTAYAKKYSRTKAAIMVGAIWSVWHLPVWLLSGYTGVELIIYIAAFVVSLVSFSVLMAIFYDKCKNILVPIFFHYMINYILSFYTGNDLMFQVCSSIAFCGVAVALSVVYDKKRI